MPRRRRLLLAAITFATTLAVAPVAVAETPGPSPLERSLLSAVQGVGFGQVVDFDSGASPAPQVAATPNVDVAVFALTKSGRVSDAADVLLSRDYPNGALVPINRNLGTTSVRYKAWDIDRWDGVTAWNAPFGPGTDIVPGRESAPLQFMSPYPASLFKVLVAFGVLRLADKGALSLSQPYTYTPPPVGDPATGLCGDGAPITRTINDWLDPMISESSNQSTCAMLKLLHDRPGRTPGTDGVDDLNAQLAAIGLGTLQVNGTNPANGGRWNPGEIHVTALDMARFFLLVDGGQEVLWRTDAGRPVKSDVLSDESRATFQRYLADQGFREVLSTTNFCGLAYPAPGIPARVAERWIQPDGTVTVDGVPYPADVRPCNAAATVDFLDKTGLTYNYGSDAGIVRNLPGKPQVHYIVSILSNLGYRYGDPQFANLLDLPCFSAEANYACYTQKFSQLGAKVHELLSARRPGQGSGEGPRRDISSGRRHQSIDR